MASRKFSISPPNWQACATTHYFLSDETGFTHAGTILRDVAGTGCYRAGLTMEIERDILRACCLQGRGFGMRVGIGDQGRPFIYFPSTIAERWLEAGGRAWILAEIEARAGGDVIPFPRRPD